MSGVAGADRVKNRQDFKRFLDSYQKVISRFPGFVSMKPSGSYNSNPDKQDFGDIDLIVHIQSDKDKATVKKELGSFFTKMPDTVIVPFSSEKHAGKRTYNAGELVTVRYHDEGLGYSAQIDNIVALDQGEASFKQKFLDLPAEKQGLILGLTKIATIETPPEKLFKSLNISVPSQIEPNQEYEFNLSSVEIQLRLVTYKPGTYEQIDKKVLWTSKNFEDLKKILYQYNLDADFDNLLAQSKQNIKNPRSNNRMIGVFNSMITVKSGEEGTAKGEKKRQDAEKIKKAFSESRLLNELIKPQAKTMVFAFGRFQPPTTGHKLLINAVKQAAEQNNADYTVFVSKTQDKKSNPLDISTKMHFMELMFPGTNLMACNEQIRTPIEAAKSFDGQYKNLIMIAGSDRQPSFEKLLNDYNGKEYTFDSIKVISAGERDPDSDGAEGMSATKMRAAALEDNFKEFRKGLPNTISDEDGQKLMDLVKKGLGMPKKAKAVKEIGQAQMAGPSGPQYDTTGNNRLENVGEAKAKKQRLDKHCWKGYRKAGTKVKGGVRVNNCVKVGEGWELEITKLIKLLENKP